MGELFNCGMSMMMLSSCFSLSPDGIGSGVVMGWGVFCMTSVSGGVEGGIGSTVVTEFGMTSVTGRVRGPAIFPPEVAGFSDEVGLALISSPGAMFLQPLQRQLDG